MSNTKKHIPLSMLYELGACNTELYRIENLLPVTGEPLRSQYDLFQASKLELELNQKTLELSLATGIPVQWLPKRIEMILDEQESSNYICLLYRLEEAGFTKERLTSIKEWTDELLRRHFERAPYDSIRHVYNQKLEDLSIGYFQFNGGELYNCKLEACRIYNAEVYECELDSCTLTGCNIIGKTVSHDCRFIDCKLDLEIPSTIRGSYFRNCTEYRMGLKSASNPNKLYYFCKEDGSRGFRKRRLTLQEWNAQKRRAERDYDDKRYVAEAIFEEEVKDEAK